MSRALAYTDFHARKGRYARYARYAAGSGLPTAAAKLSPEAGRRSRRGDRFVHLINRKFMCAWRSTRVEGGGGGGGREKN